MVCAFGLHLAFPLAGWWWLAPFAFAGLSASWCALPPGWAAFAGYLSGLVYFGFGFSWFGETAGSLVGPFAPILVLGPAAIEALSFAFAALVASLAARRVDLRAVPVVVAAAFATFEAMRSEGVLGVPFSQLGVAMIDSPLRAIAAFGGGYALTFATAVCGASLGWWLLARGDGRRLRVAVAWWAAIVVCAAAAFALWPARIAAGSPAGKLAVTKVAAVQGGIEQSLKATPDGLALALQRYTALTQSLRMTRPHLILWPETVIMTDVTRYPQLEAQFAALARETGALLYVGNVPFVPGVGPTNSLAIFDPRVPGDAPAALYQKEQLVPFAEYVPGPAWLRSLPLVDNVGAYRPGRNTRETYDGIAPLICWESVFGDLAHARLRDNPSLLLIATDDAWFGTTQGPYEHAQAATLRAVETGRWIVRAAATGISGIIAPDGRWTRRTTISTVPVVVTGDVGPPAPGPYARWGPLPVELVLIVAAALPFFVLRRRAA